MKNSETKDFVAYEYLSLNVDSEKEALYIDCYESFGWMLVNSTYLVDKEDYYINNYNVSDKKLVNLKFKRDRKVKNKAQLLALQRKLEGALKELSKLERIPSSMGIIWAMIIGVVGTIFLAISVFQITGSNPNYVIFAMSGFIGIVGWVLPYFTYRKVKSDKEKENISLIEEEYNTIYDICEQASKLIG